MAEPETTDPSDALGRRIAELRGKLGWTQQELASRLGASRVAVSHLESGISVPSERTIALLAGIFKVEPHELVRGTSYPGAKAERLPVVVTRYTEVEHQLALLERDLDRIGARGGAAAEAVIEKWRDTLRQLALDAFDAREQAAIATAQRRLADHQTR